MPTPTEKCAANRELPATNRRASNLVFIFFSSGGPSFPAARGWEGTPVANSDLIKMIDLRPVSREPMWPISTNRLLESGQAYRTKECLAAGEQARQRMFSLFLDGLLVEPELGVPVTQPPFVF